MNYALVVGRPFGTVWLQKVAPNLSQDFNICVSELILTNSRWKINLFLMDHCRLQGEGNQITWVLLCRKIWTRNQFQSTEFSVPQVWIHFQLYELTPAVWNGSFSQQVYPLFHCDGEAYLLLDKHQGGPWLYFPVHRLNHRKAGVSALLKSLLSHFVRT